MISEVRHGRNFIRAGDLVRVRPSRKGKHDGFVARFRGADTDRGGLFYELFELTANGKLDKYRSVRPERVKRIAGTKQPWR